MNESSYGSQLTSKIEKQLGGKIEKLSDRTGLGRPDYLWIKHGIGIFIETKIGKYFEYDANQKICYPWKEVNDLRQFEVCKRWSKHALVLYAIYYPKIKSSAILHLDELEGFRVPLGGQAKPCLQLISGHGILEIQKYAQEDRKFVYDRLIIERGKTTQGIS